MKKRTRTPEIHFYERRVGSWRTSTTRARLDSAGRGIFWELLDVCYTQGSIPKNREDQAALAGCSVDEIDRYWPVLKKHFLAHKSDSDSLTNPQADLYRREYFHYVKRQKSSGSAGGRKKAGDKPNGNNEKESTGLENGKPLGKPIQQDTIQHDTTREETTRERASAPPPSDAGDANTSKIATLPNREPLNGPPYRTAWQFDESFEPLVTLYRESGAAVIDDDFAEAHASWTRLDWEARARRVDSFRAKVEAGEFADPAFIPRPRKFIESEWKRPIVTRQQQQKTKAREVRII